jgi:hypothetical protein
MVCTGGADIHGVRSTANQVLTQHCTNAEDVEVAAIKKSNVPSRRIE